MEQTQQDPGAGVVEQAQQEAGVGVAEPTGAAPTPEQGRVGRWQHQLDRLEGEAGMSTAEYAVGTVAACAFAAVLYKVVTGGSVVTALGDLVASALATLG